MYIKNKLYAAIVTTVIFLLSTGRVTAVETSEVTSQVPLLLPPTYCLVGKTHHVDKLIRSEGMGVQRKDHGAYQTIAVFSDCTSLAGMRDGSAEKINVLGFVIIPTTAGRPSITQENVESLVAKMRNQFKIQSQNNLDALQLSSSLRIIQNVEFKYLKRYDLGLSSHIVEQTKPPEVQIQIRNIVGIFDKVPVIIRIYHAPGIYSDNQAAAVAYNTFSLNQRYLNSLHRAGF